MEKVAEWYWKPSLSAERQLDAYWWDGQSIIIARAGERPEDARERIAPEIYMQAAVAKQYHKLTPNQKAMHDFLKAKGF